MTQTIDPIKLKAAAEHLEWVLQQYPGNDEVQGMLHGLLPLIEDARAGKIFHVMERQDVPFNWQSIRKGFTTTIEPHLYEVLM